MLKYYLYFILKLKIWNILLKIEMINNTDEDSI